MWNTNIPSEFNPSINSAQPSGGVTPLRYELARHVNLEKRRDHAEIDRRLQIRANWITLSQWVYDTTNLYCQTALYLFKPCTDVPSPNHRVLESNRTA